MKYETLFVFILNMNTSSCVTRLQQVGAGLGLQPEAYCRPCDGGARSLRLQRVRSRLAAAAAARGGIKALPVPAPRGGERLACHTLYMDIYTYLVISWFIRSHFDALTLLSFSEFRSAPSGGFVYVIHSLCWTTRTDCLQFYSIFESMLKCIPGSKSCDLLFVHIQLFGYTRDTKL